MIIIIFTMSTIIILMMIRLTMSVHGSEQKQMFFPKLLHSPPVTSIQYHRLLTQMTVMIMIFMILMIMMMLCLMDFDDDDDDCSNQVNDQCQDYLVPSDCRQRFGVNHARDLKIDQLSNHDNLDNHLHHLHIVLIIIMFKLNLDYQLITSASTP